MMDLYIANKDYSSWSLRPWVMMRELEIPLFEGLVPFGDNMGSNAFRSQPELESRSTLDGI